MQPNLQAVIGIQAALLEREKTGKGQFVDVSLCESAMILGISALSQGLAGGLADRGTGHLDGGLPNYNIYATSDGRYLSVGALEPHFWTKFCKFVNAEHLIKASGDEVKDFIATKTYDEWSALAAECDACIEPVLRVSELISHPQHVARGVFLETSTSESGTHPPQVVLGPRLSNHPPRWLGRAAYHGEHNEEIFKNSLEESIESCVCDLEKPALEMDNDASPLHGVKVLDLTRLLPGPLCTHVLVRLGASVVKVEAPDGDYARFVPPLIK
jgi:crotonobetainyl-CoA:carnitine CoA-transferase CaiB-like acyl-CoA transferase